MRGISSSSKNKIHELVDELFDRMALHLIGEVPSLRNKKSVIFTSKPDLTLSHLFLKSLGSERLLPQEKEALKNLLSTAEEYISALRAKTKAQLTESIDSYIKEQILKNQKPSTVEIKNKINETLTKARDHFKTIAEAESTKARNMGKALQIGKVAASQGVQDPNVYYVVIRDGKTCSECVRLHLMDDLITPRVWKLSEIGFSYHKKGQPNPKISGLHPHCFTENMMLHTDRGLMSFKDLFEKQKNNRVIVDSRIDRKKSTTNKFRKSIPNTAQINRNSNKGTKILPATHVYYTGDQECYRITLTSGHSIEVSHGHEMWVDDGKYGVKIQAKDLKVGDRIPILQPNEGHFGSENFPELAELIGNLLGGGSLSDSMAIWEKTLSELSSQSKRVPKKIWSANKKTVFAFLRGLYAASGHSDKDGIVLSDNNLEFLREIQLVLSMSGFTSRIFNHDGAWILRISEMGLILRFYNEIGMGVPVKQEKLGDFLETNYSPTKNKTQLSWHFSRVEKIENIGIKPTYCLTEPVLNTVTVNGIVTGQCRCSLAFLAPGFGFKAGRVVWIGEGHDEYKAQRG
jgi:hypothetical protein